MNEPLDGYRASHLEDDHAREYDAELRDVRTAMGLNWTLEQKLLGRLLDRLAPPPRTALDFACGTGRILDYLAHRGVAVTGVDISPAMLAIASDRVPGGTLVCGDVTKEPGLVEGQFDLATAFRFFLNAEPDLRLDAIRWLRGVVRPGGRLVANFHLNPRSARGAYLRVRLRGDAALRSMSIAEARALFAAGGFRTLSVHGYDFLPFRRGGNALVLPRLRARVEAALLDRRGLAGVAGTFVLVGEPVQ